ANHQQLHSFPTRRSSDLAIKSSFQLVPERPYRVPGALLEEIRNRGFEICVHDLNHDGQLFSDHKHFLRMVERINAYGREYRASRSEEHTSELQSRSDLVC